MQEIGRTSSCNELASDPTGQVRPVYQMTELTKIDRIDDKGDIREHWTRDGRRTICGVAIWNKQPAYGNRPCRRCAKIATRCQIAPPAASGEQIR